MRRARRNARREAIGLGMGSALTHFAPLDYLREGRVRRGDASARKCALRYIAKEEEPTR